MLNKVTNNQRTLQWLRDNVFFLLLLLTLPLPYLSSDLVYLNYTDMYRYLDVVKDFQNDHWYMFFTKTRTNLFPLILFINFKFFGTSLIAIKYLYVFITILLLIECWVLGKMFFKNHSGIITATLVCTSYSFLHFLYFPHIDLLVIVMLLLCMIVLFIALDKKPKSTIWLVFSGVLIGFGFLLKESVIWLLFFHPIYSILKHVKFKQIIKQWSVQLLPLLLIAAPIIYFNSNGFYTRYIAFPMNWILLVLSGNTDIIANNAGGIYQQKASLLNMFTFLFVPIFWQWEMVLPIPKNLIILEQFLIVSSGLYYFIRKAPLPNSKLFLLTALIVFLPRYIVFSVNAYKIRQVLPFFFVLYPILGNACYNIILRSESLLLQHTTLSRIRMATIFFFLTFYCLRMLFCIDGISYTLNSAEFNYQRKQILPLHSEIK